MRSGVAAMLAAILVFESMFPAVRACAQTAAPFPEIPIPRQEHHSHAMAYVTMLAGVGLVGGSFVLSRKADDTYDEYLAATDPETIDRLYDETRKYDTLATTSLITGEALVVLGLYLRFLRHPRSEPGVGLLVEPNRCALSLRF